MAHINLLGASGINAGKVSKGGALGLEFRKGVQGVVVVKVVVNGGLLVVAKRMVQPDLELVAAISSFRNRNGLAAIPTRARHVIQQAYCHGVKTLRWNDVRGKKAVLRKLRTVIGNTWRRLTGGR